jgi:outer membrane receptor protein involved in Fe transport
MKITKLFITVFSLLLNLFFSAAVAQTGAISGRITDSKTHEALIGVNIIINELVNIGTASDIDGRFIIKVPVGSYSLKVSLMGYIPLIKTDIVVRTGREINVNMQLSETTIDVNEVIVKADYFDKSKMENDLSTVSLGAEEVRRSPGSSLDVQRILQGMAGVSFSSDRTNELIVRGGSPDENLVILDNMEIHSINHFPNQENSSGAINMLNVALLQDIQFSTGGFISKYGDKLSSVMNITSREGTRNKSFNGNFNFSMAGVGTILEGRINEGNGSWLVSARNSFLSLVKDAIGLTSVPKYQDIQFRLAYDLSSKHKLSCSGIYGRDEVFNEGESDETNLSLASRIDSVSLFDENIKQYQFAAGITLRSVWENNFYSLFTIYGNNYHYDVDETERFVCRKYDAGGNVFQSTMLNEKTAYDDIHDNGEIAFKGEFVWNIGKTQELNFGASFKTIRFKQSIFTSGDSSRYDTSFNGWNTQDDIYVGEQSSRLEYDLDLFKNLKSYLFVNDKIKLFNDRFILNLGLRYDYSSYSSQGNLSPRISASYSIIPGLTNINFSYGEYYQTHSFSVYSDRYKSEVNRNLRNTFARHFVLGIEQILDDGLKLTIEGYHKKYSGIPVTEEFIHFYDRTFRSEKYLNVGEKYCFGFDLLIQKKLVGNFFGTVAYSRMWSKYDDPRIGMEGKEYSSDYEFPHVLTLILGRRFVNLRDGLDKMPFYVKYPTYLFPFSNDMEISVRWRYASGKVYTPKVFVTNEQYYEGEVRWSKGNWISAEGINSERYPDYHRLDIAFNSRYNFSSWSLSIFLSIENIYNRKNIARYRHNSDGTRETVYQFALFPVAGLEIQF